MLAQRRRAAAAKAAALAVKAGASAYAVSEKGGGLTYGEVDAEDLLKCVNTFCAPLPDGGFWDLGSGAGSAALAAAHAFDAFAAGSGGVELQPRLHGLAVERRGRLLVRRERVVRRGNFAFVLRAPRAFQIFLAVCFKRSLPTDLEIVLDRLGIRGRLLRGANRHDSMF